MKPVIILEVEEAKEVLDQIDKQSELYKNILDQIVKAEGGHRL